MRNDDKRSYFEQREQAERDAARQAACPEARRAHEELAKLYALAGAGGAEPVVNDRPLDPHATIITRIR